MSTNAAGVACCGNCGSELEVRCTGGCAEPDIVPRENYIATMPQRAQTKEPKIVKYPPPTHCWCGEPVAQRAKYGVGRPPTKCEKHVVRKKAVA
jgi:hypothetical protein